MNTQALGHFNVSDSTQFNAILAAAQDVGTPVWIGVSEGEEAFIGVDNIAALVRAARERGIEVYLNADHHHSIEGCKRSIDAGFDAVIFDGVELSYEENIEKTKEVVEYAHERGVLVEGELGYIGTSSKMLDEVPEGAGLEMTTPEQAQDFVARTGVDMIAPSVGNLHGMLKEGNPKLDIERIAAIKAAVPDTTLVLHGGSGISDDDFRAAIEAGIGIVHINTEIRKAYREGIESALANDPTQITPYKYLNKGYDAVKAVVMERLILFTNSH